MGALPGSSPLLAIQHHLEESLSCLENERVRQGLSKPSFRLNLVIPMGLNPAKFIRDLKDRVKKKKRPDSRQAKI